MTRTRTVDVGDVTLTVDESGEPGGRPILFVHGFTGSRTDFELALDRLPARGWHAVAPDLRGHGASSHPPDEDDYGFERFADDVLALADALGWATFTLLGHSMGGMVVQVAALRAPERLRALVLMDTSPSPLTGGDTALLDAVVEAARTQGIDVVADLMQGFTALESGAYRRAVERDPSYGERGDRNRRSSSAAMFAAMVLEMGSQADRVDALATLDVPTLVIVGDEDEPFLAPSRRMAAAIPGARLAVVPDAGHSPQFEAPEAWWDALSTFLADLDG